MKVKCIKNYFDLELNRAVKELEEFEVSDARAKELSTVNNKAGKVLVEILEAATPTPEVVTEEQPKKRGRKPKKEAK